MFNHVKFLKKVSVDLLYFPAEDSNKTVEAQASHYLSVKVLDCLGIIFNYPVIMKDSINM